MGTLVGFKLDEEGGKSFLERVVFERESDTTIAVGLQKPNGDWYAWATLTEQQLIGALQILELLMPEGETEQVGFPLGTKVKYVGSATEGYVRTEACVTQRIEWADKSQSAVPIHHLKVCE